jgi:hypothetical protein
VGAAKFNRIQLPHYIFDKFIPEGLQSFEWGLQSFALPFSEEERR